MFAPRSPLTTVGFTEDDFEWVEVYNNTNASIDFVQHPHVFDDDDDNILSGTNINAGALAAGEIGILFNSERITADDMRAIWGAAFNYIPVSQWPSLNNGSGGDTIAIWEDYSDYYTDSFGENGRTQENAVAAVAYNTLAGQGWPTVNNQSSIYLHNLSGDPNNGANWKRAGAAGDTLSHQASPIFDSAIDHEGGDVGSPGYAPGPVTTNPDGDYNGNGVVDPADYLVWRKFFGETSSLPNDPDVGTTIDHDQYNTWMENFGATTAGSGALVGEVVPEPTSFTLLAIGLMFCCLRRCNG